MRILNKLMVTIGWGFASVLLLCFLGVLALIWGFRPNFESKEPVEIKTENAVGVVSLTGEIFESSEFKKELDEFLENEKIHAIVVRIDSPGGVVGASQELYQAIRLANEKKPIVCSLGSIAASGGLYAAMGCKKIITNGGTLTGSIGVIMMMPNVGSIMDRFGVNMLVVKSGQYKDAGSPFRPVTAEDKTLLQGIVDATYQQFVKTISVGRNLPEDKVRAFADGRIIIGEEAVKIGLADEVGDLTRAGEVALGLSGGTGKPELVRKKKPTGLIAALGEASSGIQSFTKFLAAYNETRLLYRAFF